MRWFLLWMITLGIYSSQLFANDSLKIVFQDSNYQLTGVAISKDNRIFTCYPYWSKDRKWSVVEISETGEATPFPDLFYNQWNPDQNGKDQFVCPQALWVDKKNRLWVVDPANPQFEGTVEGAVKLTAIDLDDNKVEQTIFLPDDVADKNSYINDIRIDDKRQIAYLTNSNQGAIIVVNLVTGGSWKFLDQHYSTKSDSSYIFKPGGNIWQDKNGRRQIHSDGIALDPQNKYLYYKSLTDDKLYRIKTKNLRNYYIKEKNIHKKVEYLGHICTSDGMIFSEKGDLFLGDLEKNSIVKYSPKTKKAETVITDERLAWPDSYAFDAQGNLYIACSMIHQMPDFNEGNDIRKTPFTIYKLQLKK